MQKLDQQTLNFTDEHIANIAAMFPHCVTEVEDENGRLKKAIDFDLLKQELSANIVEGPKERYRTDWPGKRASLVSANTPITKTLRPAVEESVNFDTTENLYIEGDNLEALKLLQESYLGAIKMIYIDPPYNTGKDFVYKDNFTRSKEEELQESGQVDEEGGRLVANLESNGRFHSDWLSMMYPRLRLARNLLKDDGVIFISIDDNEVHNLRKICDEIFGEDNFIASLLWKRRTSSALADKNVSTDHEYVIIYGKSNSLSFLGTKKDFKSYKNLNNDPKGPWMLDNLTVGMTATMRPNQAYTLMDPETGNVYPCNPNRVWAYIPATMNKMIEKGLIYFPKDTTKRPMLKRYQSSLKNLYNPFSTLMIDKVGLNTEATRQMQEIMGGNLFEYSKPLSLLKTLMPQITNNNDIILDFFAGSSVTAHATMQLNAEDGGNRKFIMVQLPEETDEKSEAYKAGYKTIAEIGKERIRRAGKKIVEENADKEGIEDLDIGFRVLKIDESNMKDIYFTPDAVDRASLFDTVDHIKEDRTPEDLLFGVLVDWGVDLTLPIRRESIHGKTVFFVGHDDLTACFDEDLGIEFIKELAGRDAMRVVFKESGFKDDETKINAEQIFTQLSPGTDLRVI